MSKVVMILLLFCCCDLTRCYRLLYVVFFTLRKGISGEYTLYLIQASSNSIHLGLGKHPYISHFYIQTHLTEPTKRSPRGACLRGTMNF